MKSNFHIPFILFISLTLAFQGEAQLILNGTIDNYFGQLDNLPGSQANWTRSIGIGYFGSGFPNSFLHINSNIGLLPANGSIANYGEVFRTDAPADATTAWRMFSGNVSANEKFNIRNTTATNHVVFGTVQSGHLDFHTNNTFRGRLASDGGFYLSGTSGANPNLGVGTRLMWVPQLAAFRAGGLDVLGSTRWDSPNVGQYSVALGLNGMASGTSSVCLGSAGVASGHNSMVFGNGNTASADNSIALGSANSTTGVNSMVFGQTSTVSSINSASLGQSNTVASPSGVGGNLAMGLGNSINADQSFAWGLLNSISNGGGACVTSFAVGCSNSITGASNAYALGVNLAITADEAFCIGTGLAANPLLNSFSKSLMVGFNSNVPTLFVSGGNGTIGSFGRVGFGNITSPTHLIDANGNARFRQMPATAGNVLVTGVQEGGLGDYSLSSLEFSGFDNEYLGGDGFWHQVGDLGCTWNNTGANLTMGYASHCADKVGVGTSSPFAKLDVQSDVLATGVSSRVSAVNQSNVIAVDARASLLNANQTIFGVRAGAFNNTSCQLAHNLSYAYGVHTTANNASRNFAIYASALPHITLSAQPGDPTPPAQCTAYSQGWAGYFNGATFTSSGNWSASDENLKTNILDIANAGELLSNIQTATYTFNQEAYPGLALPAGQHWGVLAQQLEQIAPSMVTNVVQPAQYDEAGNEISPEYAFKAVNYEEFTPILIAGFQELTATVEAQQAQIEALTAFVQNCCASGGDKSLQGSGSTSSPTEPADFDLRIEQAYLGQNVPNPFASETTITYRIPAQAQVRVRIVGQSGQQIDTLVDGLMPRGEYRIIWNASHLPAGMYYYTLEADGVELVKKAVKL